MRLLFLFSGGVALQGGLKINLMDLEGRTAKRVKGNREVQQAFLRRELKNGDGAHHADSMFLRDPPAFSFVHENGVGMDFFGKRYGMGLSRVQAAKTLRNRRRSAYA